MTREEALQAIKAKMDYYENDKRLRGALETLIPELYESEDELIRPKGRRSGLPTLKGRKSGSRIL